MKNIYLSLIITWLFLPVKTIAQESKGRWLLGTGVTYCSYIDNPGLNLNVTYRVVGNFHIGPDFSALLTHERKENGRIVKQKELEYNLNAHQLFELNEKLSWYPLVGINWSKVTAHPDGEEASVRWLTAFNSGGGVELKWRGVRFFFESKWVSRIRKFDLTTGAVFTL